MSKDKKTDLLVIGAGSGGYPAAFHAADLGMDVTLVDPGLNPGGVCLHRGCVPTAALENVSVEINDKGFIAVDAQRRTSEASIFAVGDVAGEPMLAHKATHEGRVAAEAAAGKRVAFEPRGIPFVVFSDHEIAGCGLSEPEAKSAGRAVRVTTFPWGASGRALTLDRPDGVTKMLCDPDTGRILGVGMVGRGAGELLGEATLALEMGAVADDIGLTIHTHPTLSETLMEAAQAFGQNSTHFIRK